MTLYRFYAIALTTTAELAGVLVGVDDSANSRVNAKGKTVQKFINEEVLRELYMQDFFSSPQKKIRKSSERSTK